MELLAPAGSPEKLKTVYNYGADAAYIGINQFSLRQKADNFSDEDFRNLAELKQGRKLYGAFNIYFHNRDLKRLEAEIEMISRFPLDAFIISDIGAVPFLQKHFPDTELHLSTQANCINVEAARLYRDMGFSRVILGREAALDEIKEIKDTLPDLELETFVHGAMCLAYSGRCFLSRYMADRSGNKGDCSHTCRWQYSLKGPAGCTPGVHSQSPEPGSERVENIEQLQQIKTLAESGELALEEELRPGESFPIYEGDGFTTILSSKDLCLIDHMQQLADAGIDSFKIEGRMKSLYYAAVITRAYRKAVDRVKGMDVPDFNLYREEIFKVSHREFTTGFFFGDRAVHSPTTRSYLRQHIFLGTVDQVSATDDPGVSLIEVGLKNQLKQSDQIEVIGPDSLYKTVEQFELLDKDFQPVEKSDHGKVTYIKTNTPMQQGDLLRREITRKEDPDKNNSANPAAAAGWG